MNPINQLKSKIIRGKKEVSYLDTWMYFIFSFKTWISLDEFLKMPAEITDEIVEKLNEINERRIILNGKKN